MVKLIMESLHEFLFNKFIGSRGEKEEKLKKISHRVEKIESEIMRKIY